MGKLHLIIILSDSHNFCCLCEPNDLYFLFHLVVQLFNTVWPAIENRPDKIQNFFNNMSMSMTIFHMKRHHYRYNASVNKFCDNFSILIGLLISVLFVCLCAFVPNEYEPNTIGSDFISQVMTWKWHKIIDFNAQFDFWRCQIR